MAADGAPRTFSHSRHPRRCPWLWQAIRSELPPLAGVLTLSCVASALSLAPPYLTKLLIDDGLVPRDLDVITTLCAAMLAFAVCAALLQTLTLRLHTRVSGRVLFGLRTCVFAHLLTLSPDWHARHSVGDTLSRLDGDIAAAQRFAVDTLLTALNAMLSLLMSLALMLYLDPRLSLVILCIAPLQLLCVHLLREKISDRARAVRGLAGEIATFLYDALSTTRFLQLSNAESLRISQLGTMSDRYVDAVLRLKTIGLASVTIPGFVTTAMIAIVFYIGAYQLRAGAASVGTLVALATFAMRATAPLGSLLGLYVSTRRVQVNLDRVDALLRERAAVQSPMTPRRLPPSGRGRVELEAVEFTYPLGGSAVLSGVTATIEPGTKVGIVGRSAAGKSTVVDLLARHYDPQRGVIRLDGVPLPELELGELRRCVAVIAQDPTIVRGTVAENIAFMQPGAGRDAIIAASRAAGLHEEVSSLPSGYDSELNTRGDILSGGQRQRLTLARAFLQRPRVLILDEAISAVDTMAAILLSETVDRLFSDVTRIIISHRPEPLSRLDALYLIEGGRLRRMPVAPQAVNGSRLAGAG